MRMSGLGDLQACPWCVFVGTSRLFDLHMETHEQSPTEAQVEELIEAKAEIKRLKDRMIIMQDEDILHEIFHERRRQEDKWGEQNHPDGTGDPAWTIAITPEWERCTAEKIADLAKQECSNAAEEKRLTFLDIALEEIAEAFAETDPELLRAELIQTCAVLVNWVGAIDRRKTKENEDGKSSAK